MNNEHLSELKRRAETASAAFGKADYSAKRVALADMLSPGIALELIAAYERATEAGTPAKASAIDDHQQAVSDLRKAAWERDPEAALSAQLRVFAAFDARAEEARREGIQIGAERTAASYSEYIKTSAAAQRQAGGDARITPEFVDKAREALDSMDDYARMESSVAASGPVALLKSFIDVAAGAPVAEAAAQADDGAAFNCRLCNEPLTAETYKAYGCAKCRPTPTAQPTPKTPEIEGFKTVEFDGIAAQPTPPDDELTMLKEQAQAWCDICAVLDEMEPPEWMNMPDGVTSREAAIAVIRAALRQPGALPDEAPVPGWLIEYDAEDREVRIKQDGMKGIVPNPMVENLAERTLYALGRALAAKQAGKEA